MISIICLLLSIAVFSLLRSLASLRNTIHINLCTNLALAQFLFILAAGREVFPEHGDYKVRNVTFLALTRYDMAIRMENYTF